MRIYKIGTFGWAMFSAITAFAQPQCDAPELSVDRIREIIAMERAKRSDLPKPFSSFTWVIVSSECHYRYSELAEPFGQGKERNFIVNRRGIIIDVDYGHP